MAIDAEAAARSHLQGAGSLVRLRQLVEDLRAAFEVFASDLGKTHPPRGAVQQPHAKALLQVLHVLADHARGNVEPFRGAGKAADFRDLSEDPHVVEAIHFSPDCEAITDSLSSETCIIKQRRSFHLLTEPRIYSVPSGFRRPWGPGGAI